MTVQNETTPNQERTGAHTDDAAVLITGARERIDVLDERIIALVRERMAVSERIQRARITSGGSRVNPSREREILGRYRESLGTLGTSISMALLELCRGRF
jgi:chorismate mutase